jgi:lipopolysaccharide transport system ATP-binding protein
MSKTAIKVENLSKIYRLGEIGTGSIGQDVDRWFKTKILGKEDPFLKIGEANDRANKGNSDFVYSLRDISFEIQQGDAVGIIGRNGAGKSTLLKILSRVTTPTTGKINIKGRVASLLEVGTGFHPELTGRENIFLNGAILGMRKREIDRKLDEIIDFSGVERYIDTPVKRYSSGMYVRLAFAVAAHLESEILIVDEVLAVGDAEFQKKCLGKMGEVSKGEGRTILFVSHNLSSINQLCTSGMLLTNGLLQLYSPRIQDVTTEYLSQFAVDIKHQWLKNGLTEVSEFYDPLKMYLRVDGNVLDGPIIQNSKRIELVLEFNVSQLNRELEIRVDLIHDEKVVFATQHTDVVQENWPIIKKGFNRLVFALDLFKLNLLEFELRNYAYLYQKTVLLSDEDLNQPIIKFKMTGVLSDSPYWQFTRPGPIAPVVKWNAEN